MCPRHAYYKMRFVSAFKRALTCICGHCKEVSPDGANGAILVIDPEDTYWSVIAFDTGIKEWL